LIGSIKFRRTSCVAPLTRKRRGAVQEEAGHDDVGTLESTVHRLSGEGRENA